MQWGTEFLISRTDKSHFTCNGAQNSKYKGGEKHLKIPFHMQWGTKLLLTNLRKPKKSHSTCNGAQTFYRNKVVRTTGKNPIFLQRGMKLK